MARQRQECARHRQVTERTAKKQSNLTTYAAVVLAALATYALMTFGLGHMFGVI